MMSLSHVCNAVNGQLIGADVMAQNVAINTRSDCDGRLFIALKGDNFDAHDFVKQAKDSGAVALMVERDVDCDLPTVKVASTHQALKDLAAWWRSQFAIPLLGITGSVGKTTVKEMLGAIFAELGRGVVTKGNLNNEIGVPLTLMRLNSQDQYAVVEMGMNHAGEIGRLTEIARPTVALVNNAAAAHLEGLGTIEAVAHAKGEIFSGLAVNGVAVINLDDPFADLWLGLVGDKRVITFGLKSGADVSASFEQQGRFLQLNVTALGESVEARVNSVGEHNACNVLAAIAMACAANISLGMAVKGLENYQPVNGRLQPIQLNDFLLFDDTYNANPASMQAAIRVLRGYENNLLIVGDMAELGDSAEAEHYSLGEYAAAQGVDRLWVCGRYASLVSDGFSANGQSQMCMTFASQEQLLLEMASQFNESELTVSAILVKGSRSSEMERVVESLRLLSNKRNTNADVNDVSREVH